MGTTQLAHSLTKKVISSAPTAAAYPPPPPAVAVAPPPPPSPANAPLDAVVPLSANEEGGVTRWLVRRIMHRGGQQG